jgi:subtilisin family serine protease
VKAIGAALVMLSCLAVGACMAPQQRPAEPATTASLEHQVLVMLRAAAPHFRPDVSYVGGYDAGAGRAAQMRIAKTLANQHALTIVDDWPMPVLGVDCFVMQTRDAASLEQLIRRLAADPRVESVQAMNVFRVLAHSDSLYPLQPSARAWALDDLHKVATGKRVRIAIIDTGVEIDHPDLMGRITLTRNFVDDRADVAEFHGTAVAGVIGARADNAVGIAGIAPDADLLALRACWQPDGRAATAVCSTFTLAKALQFSLEERVGIINLSVGGPRDRLLDRLLDVASARGAIVVAAVDSSAGMESFPASHRAVLAVADIDGQDASFAIMLAPGRDVPTSIPGRQWGFVSGSSFAAAHVSGLVALLRELSPNVESKQVREALAPRGAARVAGTRRPMVDACAAIAAIGGACACTCAVAADGVPPLPR